jgi:hypothetical protein
VGVGATILGITKSLHQLVTYFSMLTTGKSALVRPGVSDTVFAVSSGWVMVGSNP